MEIIYGRNRNAPQNSILDLWDLSAVNPFYRFSASSWASNQVIAQLIRAFPEGRAGAFIMSQQEEINIDQTCNSKHTQLCTGLYGFGNANEDITRLNVVRLEGMVVQVKCVRYTHM